MNDKEASNSKDVMECPICGEVFSQIEIEKHANRCIFLNCSSEDPPRKRIKHSSSDFSTNGSIALQPSTTGTPVLPVETATLKHLKQDSDAGSSQTTSNVKSKNTCDRTFSVPLALQMRPKTLDHFIGQCHILKEGSVLRSLLDQVIIPNMILWGPPGCGKTSLAHIVEQICKEHNTKWKFVTLCAATAGIKDVQTILQIAKNDLKFGKRTVLFMDEIHRFNKKQQDVFLMSVEKGDIVLLGATTENPSFTINNALLSRCRVVVLEKLTSEQLYNILSAATRACDGLIIDTESEQDKGTIPKNSMAIEDTALKWIADISDGDARTALNNLQLVISYFHQMPTKIIKTADVENNLKNNQLLYDKMGEEHYNMISAMHKSIRGSDDNAALYWTTRMIMSGEDPRFIARRMVNSQNCSESA